MTPRSMAMPTSAGDQERARDGDGERVVEQAGRLGADDLLHDERRVGAQHHHLAVRHVDDAHDAEGDGEADGGEQQHRAQRQAVPEVLHHRPPLQVLVDGGDGVGRRALHVRRQVGRQAAEQRARVLVAARRG